MYLYDKIAGIEFTNFAYIFFYFVKDSSSLSEWSSMVQTMMQTVTLAPLPINQELEPIFKILFLINSRHLLQMILPKLSRMLAQELKIFSVRLKISPTWSKRVIQWFGATTIFNSLNWKKRRKDTPK